MNTHRIMAENIINNIDEKNRYLINSKNFVWGNLKPDIASKYKFNKHYMDESFMMIIKKIEYITTLSSKDIMGWYSNAMFNQELGVICHFLCDFFCVPHHQRWEFKHSMNKHIKYEKELDEVAKNFKNFKNFKSKNNYLNMDNLETFILKLQKQYKEKVSYENDLIFSIYVCNSVMEYILEAIELNNKLIVVSVG